MNNLWRVYEYLNYLYRCIHLHGIHSPFVFELDKAVFKETLPYYCFEEIESLRAKLLLTDKKIQVNDLGAGSQKTNAQSRKVSNIAKLAVKDTKRAQLLFRLAKHFRPKSILELGTSFGLTTAYFAKACPSADILTIEGAEQVAKIALLNFQKLNIQNINLVRADFDSVLEKQLQRFDRLDFVFFDGNHTKEATLNYFELCVEKVSDNGIFIFDDIYWSKGMKTAWKTIKKHPKTTVSIDLFHMGLVFFKNNQAKEHFTVYH